MTIISLDSITKQFAERPILNDASLAVEAGERVGIVGVNGSGKTTLLRIAARLEQPDAGRVSLMRDLRVTYLAQNPSLNPSLTVIEQIFQADVPAIKLLRQYEQATAELARDADNAALQQRVAALVPEMEAVGAWDLENDARTILTRLGITDLTARVGTLSGGQRKRVAMAQALITPADLLIFDEPTNHIDTETVAWLESFLARTTAAVLLVTHDRYFLNRVVQRIVEVDYGKLYSYPGNYSRYLELKAERTASQASEEARRQTILKKELAWLRQGAQARTTKQQARIDRISEMQAVEPERQRGDLTISVEARRLGKRVIDLHDITKHYDSRVLIDRFDLSVAKRDRIGIIGPNGQGKTTLLNIIAERIQPDSGVVEIGETVHLAYYDQESAGLDESQRVIDYIKEGAELQRTGEGALITAAQMLQRFLFPPEQHYVVIGKLSGGERRRLYLLRTLIEAPNVLLLDEPTNDLDIQTLVVLEDYLEEFQGALITVSHDRYFLDRTTERLFAFEGDGHIREYPGNYSAYSENVARREAEAPAAASKTPAKPAQSKPADNKPRKLNFKEQRELGDLEKRIAVLEAEQAQIEAKLSGSANAHQELTQLANDLDRVVKELEASFERWAALAEIAESGR